MLKFQKSEFQELFDQTYNNSEKDTDLLALLKKDLKMLDYVKITSPDNLSFVKLSSLEYNLETISPENFLYYLFISIKDSPELYELFVEKTKVFIDVFVDNNETFD